jgi:hypothetical protein
VVGHGRCWWPTGEKHRRLLTRNQLDPGKFNHELALPFQLRLDDFRLAAQDVYDFSHDVNTGLLSKGLGRLDDMPRPAIMSGVLSDMLTASLAKHSRSLLVNAYFNGHPDLIVKGVYPDNRVKSGVDGFEIRTTRKAGGAVDTHGARPVDVRLRLRSRQRDRPSA